MRYLTHLKYSFSFRFIVAVINLLDFFGHFSSQSFFVFQTNCFFHLIKPCRLVLSDAFLLFLFVKLVPCYRFISRHHKLTILQFSEEATSSVEASGGLRGLFFFGGSFATYPSAINIVVLIVVLHC